MTVLDVLKLGRFDAVSGLSLFVPLLYPAAAVFIPQLGGLIDTHLRFDPLNLVAIYSAVFSFLAIRQMIKNRESGFDPTLFVDANNESFRLVNLGNGPAHSLNVSYATRSKDDERDVEDLSFDEIETNKIIRVDETLSVDFCVDDLNGGSENWASVTFKLNYSTNLGTDKGPIYRTIESDDIDSGTTS
jgi:hypothetical protein